MITSPTSNYDDIIKYHHLMWYDNIIKHYHMTLNDGIIAQSFDDIMV